jgi:hypothetical protein
MGDVDPKVLRIMIEQFEICGVNGVRYNRETHKEDNRKNIGCETGQT